MDICIYLELTSELEDEEDLKNFMNVTRVHVEYTHAHCSILFVAHLTKSKMSNQRSSHKTKLLTARRTISLVINRLPEVK